MEGGRHGLRCKTGEGPIAHHNLMRDTLAPVHSDAGVVVGSDTFMLMVPAIKGGTLRSTSPSWTRRRRTRRRAAPMPNSSDAPLRHGSQRGGRRQAEMRNKRREAGHLQLKVKVSPAVRYGLYTPIIFEVDGATTVRWARYSSYIKQLKVEARYIL